MRVRLALLFIAVVLIWAAPSGGPRRLLAQTSIGADEIVGRVQQAFYAPGKDMKARVTMTLISAGGDKRLRDLTMLRRNGTGGEQQYFIYFHQPGDVRGMTFLVLKYPRRDDDRWLFMPALNLVRRLAARDSAQSFVGSDFTYEHVSGRDLESDRHTLRGEEQRRGKACYVVESQAQSAAEYSRKVAWIDKATWLPVEEEYYDVRGELFKVFTADEVRDIGGHPTIARRTMKNVKTGHRTEVVFADVAYDVGIEADVFSERYLREPPRRWIQ
ncbi:MAG: outer membrane lipoprotein-sorting protein [Acidobacteriota bacterium]